MKSHALTAILQPKERRRFEQYLERHRPAVLLPIFKQLSKEAKNEASPTKEQLFQRSFGKPFQEKEVEKFEQELLLLHQELILFLAKIREEEQSDAQEQLHLLEVLAKREAWDLWDKTWNRALRQAEKQTDYAQQKALLQASFKIRHQREEIDTDFLAEMQQLLQKVAIQQLKDTGEKLLDIRIRLSHTKLALQDLKPAYEAQLPHTHLAQTLFEEEPLHRYLDLLAKLYFLNGKAKIEPLKQALALQDEVEKIREKYKPNRQLLLSSLALEYTAQGQWAAADDAYRQMRPFLMEQKDLNNSLLVYNYMINTLYLGRYRDVLQLQAAYAEWVTAEHPLYPNYLYAACWAHLFLGEKDKGMQLIEEAKPGPNSKPKTYEVGLQRAILHYQMQDYEQAEQELLALQQQMLHQRKEVYQLLEPQVEALLALFKIEKRGASEKEKQAQQRALIEKVAPQISASAEVDTLAWHWLKRELNRDRE